MEKDRYKVSIVIPNYNGEEFLKRLLPSIANQTFDDYEVIIIDDFSPDRSVLVYIQTFIKNYGNMRLIENGENLGFVGTCNKGIKLASGDYICVLTNDTEVKNNFVERNVEILDADSSIGVLSCIIVDQRGKNWFSGGSFKAGLSVNLRDDFQGIRSVDFAAGTACFYRREVFNKVGFLNEYYFMYHEDIEFCLRVRDETDYRVCMFPEKLVTHYLRCLEPGQPDLAQRAKIASYYGPRNYMVLLRRHCPEYIPKVLLHNMWEIIRWLALIMLRPKPKSFLSFFQFIVLFISGTLAGLIKRQSNYLQNV